MTANRRPSRNAPHGAPARRSCRWTPPSKQPVAGRATMEDRCRSVQVGLALGRHGTRVEQAEWSARRRIVSNVHVCRCGQTGGHFHSARSCRTHRHRDRLSFRHRGLRLLFGADSSRLLKQDLADRVRGILAAPAMAETMEVFIREAAPGWRVHRLSGARRNEWSVSVSGNWRITFEERDGGI